MKWFSEVRENLKKIVSYHLENQPPKSQTTQQNKNLSQSAHRTESQK